MSPPASLQTLPLISLQFRLNYKFLNAFHLKVWKWIMKDDLPPLCFSETALMINCESTLPDLILSCIYLLNFNWYWLMWYPVFKLIDHRCITCNMIWCYVYCWQVSVGYLPTGKVLGLSKIARYCTLVVWYYSDYSWWIIIH